MSMTTGWSLEDILDFDIETFNELLEAVLRTEYHQKTEAAWTSMVAAQGDHKAMKKWVGQWSKILRGGASASEQQEQGGNLDDFLKLVGSGF